MSGTWNGPTACPSRGIRRVDGSMGRTHYKDNWYPEYRLAVEIDGPAYHENEQVQRDRERDNANLAADDVKTFRFGPVAVTERACETAAMVALTLQRNGWQGRSASLPPGRLRRRADSLTAARFIADI